MSEKLKSDANDPGLRSFVPVAADSPFPIQNLPFGVFRPRSGGEPRCGVAIGELVLDLSVVEQAGHLRGTQLAADGLFSQPSLNRFLEQGRGAWRSVREALSRMLRADEPLLRDDQALRDQALVRQRDVELLLPAEVRDYTDFYSSRHHAFNIGTMFRGPENALMPNWLWLPVAYHGRASSLVVSGTDVRRPSGQTIAPDAKQPAYGPSRLVDYELEMGFVVGPGNAQGQPIAVENADEHIFGMLLVNDWSARDIQKWEYQPLGPFLAKNFATTVAPWIVTLDALAPFRCAGPEQDPPPLAYLRSSGMRSYDIKLEVWLDGDGLPEPQRLSRGNFNNLYWDIRQQLAHHTVTGCNMRPGDLLASGTISGPTKDSRGCLLELAWRGQEPVKLAGGQERKFLADGDTVTMTGWCEGDGYRVGFGECSGKLLRAGD